MKLCCFEKPTHTYQYIEYFHLSRKFPGVPDGSITLLHPRKPHFKKSLDYFSLCLLKTMLIYFVYIIGPHTHTYTKVCMCPVYVHLFGNYGNVPLS